jgi:hypothetical protein
MGYLLHQSPSFNLVVCTAFRILFCPEFKSDFLIFCLCDWGKPFKTDYHSVLLIHPYNLQLWFSIILTPDSLLSHSDKRYAAENLSRVPPLFFTIFLEINSRKSKKLKAFLVYLKSDVDNTESMT